MPIKPIPDKELAKLNPKGKLVKQALKEFGETFDCHKAGYVLEDGTMLNLGSNPDHRAIRRAVETGDNVKFRVETMNFFEKQANAIRFICYEAQGSQNIGATLITSQKPTEKQLKRVESCCKLLDADSFGYDIHSKHEHRLLSTKQIDKPNCAMAVREMKTVFDKAKREDHKIH